MAGQAVASLWKRWLAAAIDGLLFVLPSVPSVIRATTVPRRSPGSLHVLATVMSGAYEVSATVLVGQTLGQRALGIRVVGQDTGGVPTLRQAVLRWAITAVPDSLSRLIDRSLAPKDEQALAAVRDLGAEVDRLRRQHGPDRQGLNEALMALYKERNVNPMTGCLPSVLGVLPALICRSLLYAPALRDPLHQGIHDRVAKVLVIESPRRTRMP